VRLRLRRRDLLSRCGKQVSPRHRLPSLPRRLPSGVLNRQRRPDIRRLHIHRLRIRNQQGR
jgi:hypothetical protein